MALNKDKIFKAADKAIGANKIEKAIKEYETWLNESPRDWNIVRQVGDLYSRVGRRDEAIKKYALVGRPSCRGSARRGWARLLLGF